ncbi:MAG: hypothetical protein NVSMB9_00370 [Isosphaeraceae bacterium]
MGLMLRGSRRSAVAGVLLVLLFAGCTRRYYRNFADRDVYRIERERMFDWRWRVPDRPVEANPRSRLGDVHDPNRHPMVPDDPGARPFQVTAGRPLEFVGWEKRGTAPIEDLSWLQCIPRESDGSLKIDGPSSMQIALMNSREYQFQVENVYLQCLSLTLQRFAFFPQIFSNQTTGYRQFGAKKNASSQLQLFTQDGFNWAFYSGANLLVNFANSMVFEFNGKGFQAVTSGLTFNLTQPLLRGAFARNVTQPLSLNERNTLYVVREFARFRRLFYVSTVSGYLNLLIQLQQLRNQEGLVESAKRNLEEFEALVRAGQIQAIQRDTVAQNYQGARLGLLNQQAGLQTALDSYRVVQLGLPADFPVQIDETLLKRFELNDPQLDKLRREGEKLYLSLLQYDAPPEKSVMADAARVVLVQYQALREIAKVLEGELGRWQAQLSAKEGRVGKGPGQIEEDEKESYERQVKLIKTLTKDFAQSRSLLQTNITATEEYLEKLDQLELPTAWARVRQELIGRDFRARLSELFVVQTQVRAFLIEMKMVDLTVQDAISVALANRLDLMNAQAQVTDAWRNVEVAGNALLAGINLNYNGALNTPPNHLGIFRFDAHQSLHQASIRFDAPINRRIERNAYRFDQIQFQRARRNYMLLHDVIVQTIRLDMRNLNRLRRTFDISREQLLISVRQVDQAEYSTRVSDPSLSGGGSAGLYLVQSLNFLLGAKNSLIQNWIEYEIGRMELFRNLDIMDIDARGVWTNDSNVPTFGGRPVPSTPDPVGTPDERTFPGIRGRPEGNDLVRAGPGTDPPGPPPPPTTPGAFARP